jgi:Spy/CpxP family protein refolding chaperone
MFKLLALTTLVLGFTCVGQSRFPLTDAQRQNLSSMRKQHREAAETSMQDLHARERSLREQVKAGSTDAATLGRLLIDIETSRKQMEASRKAFREQMVGTLSAEQKARLKVLEEARGLASEIHQAERLGLLDAPGDRRHEQ